MTLLAAWISGLGWGLFAALQLVEYAQARRTYREIFHIQIRENTCQRFVFCAKDNLARWSPADLSLRVMSKFRTARLMRKYPLPPMRDLVWIECHCSPICEKLNGGSRG